MAKRQQELPGAERPSIPKLDELCAAHLEAAAAAATAKETAETAKANLKNGMEEERSALELDEDDQPVYVYQDGDERTTVVLYHQEGIRCRKAKKAAQEEGEIG